MSDPVDLTQRRYALMLECGAILTDAIELMWDAGADPPEIVQTLRWAVERIEAANDCQTYKGASGEAQAGDTPG